MVANAKSNGYSLDEVRDLTVSQLVTLCDLQYDALTSTSAKARAGKPGVRKAMQSDIDAWLG